MKHAIITGASSGIGAALAIELSRRGYALSLLARRADELDRVRASLGGPGLALPCDVTDASALQAAVNEALGRFGPCDLAVANAGISIPQHAKSFNLDLATRTIQVNVLGTMHLFAAVIPAMVERRSGRFAGVASVAGLRGLPTAAPYSASKAAMQAFLEAVRVELRPYGVGVTIINPGFVETAMTQKNRFRMPFLMSAERSATIIADGLARGKRVIEFPWAMSVLTRALRYVPDAIYDRIAAPAARRPLEPPAVKP